MIKEKKRSLKDRIRLRILEAIAFRRLKRQAKHELQQQRYLDRKAAFKQKKIERAERRQKRWGKRAMQNKLKAQGKLTVALAAGGTGGHLFPARALAALLEQKGHRAIYFTDKRTAPYLEASNAEVCVIPASGTGVKGLGKAGAFWKIFKGVFKSIMGLRKHRVDVVVGFGGYPSFPTVFSAVRRKKKWDYRTVIHEQNALMGQVNRFFVPQVDAIATSFPKVAALDDAYQDKVTLTGNPVRPEILALHSMQYQPPQIGGEFHLLVLGGSQGATVFSEVVPEAIKFLPAEYQERVVVTQQCRGEDLEKVREYYANLGIRAELAPFFKNMAELYQQNHLVISRSGASTVSEVAVVGIPSILVPYPHAKDQHQVLNARHLEEKGGTWVMLQSNFTSKALSSNLKTLMNNPGMLTEAATKVKEAAYPDAAQRLLQLVEKVGNKH